ncbi:hypothetical protein LDL36_04885 [Komagataeibacter sp. FNDCR1]|nr:hypothetical protein [Komagataeibacter sp. FNDCR1]
MSAFTAPQTAGGWATLALAVVIIALGLPLVYMGAELAFLGGSWYYIIVGLAVTLQLHFVLSSESMGNHDSGYDEWRYVC